MEARPELNEQVYSSIRDLDESLSWLDFRYRDGRFLYNLWSARLVDEECLHVG
jgi:hypothetical protein